MLEVLDDVDTSTSLGGQSQDLHLFLPGFTDNDQDLFANIAGTDGEGRTTYLWHGRTKHGATKDTGMMGIGMWRAPSRPVPMWLRYILLESRLTLTHPLLGPFVIEAMKLTCTLGLWVAL